MDMRFVIIGGVLLLVFFGGALLQLVPYLAGIAAAYIALKVFFHF